MEQITLPGVIGSFPDLCAFVIHATEQAGLDPNAGARLQLAVDEIVTNIITHGYEEQGLTGDITLQSEVTPEALTITTLDTAPPFDPRDRPDPDSLNQAAEDRPIGGLGIYLTLKSVDRFDYAYADGQNRNVMAIKRG